MGRSLKGMVGSRPPLPLCIVSFLCKSILTSISLQNICMNAYVPWECKSHMFACACALASPAALYLEKRGCYQVSSSIAFLIC